MISRRQFLRGDFAARRYDPHEADGNGPRRAVVGSKCVAFDNVVCRSCADACGVAAIRFSPRPGGAALPEVLADRCTGCGDCVSACPVGAVRLAPGGKS